MPNFILAKEAFEYLLFHASYYRLGNSCNLLKDLSFQQINNAKKTIKATTIKSGQPTLHLLTSFHDSLILTRGKS